MLYQVLPRRPLPPQVLFLGGGGSPTSGADATVHTWLQAWFGAENVEYKSGGSSLPADADGKALIVISSTLSSSTVRGKFNTHPVGILSWEEALMGSGGTGNFAMTTSRGKSSGNTQIDIVDNGHPITQGVPLGILTVTTSGQIYSHDTGGTLGAGVSRLADRTLDPTNAVIYVIERAGILADGLPAAGRRVMFFLENDTANALNIAGQDLLRRACRWAAGLI